MFRRISAIGLMALGVALGGSTAFGQTIVSTDITTNTTWGNATNPSPIILQATLFVKNGAILTILPGTIIRGQPRQAAVVPGSTVGAPGALIVTQNGRINAVGTATQPIIWTTAAIDNNNDGIADDLRAPIGFKDEWTPGDTFLDDTPTTAPLAPLDKAGNANLQLWGSLVILGSAPTNLADKCGVGYGKCTVEGLTVPGYPAADCTYGGVEPHDNSGILKYNSLRYGGDEIGNSNELNGISLAGVGDGTTIDNLEVFTNFDDGIEWFGGTVNASHLAVFFQGDDAFDLDEGYTGVNQFLFNVAVFFNQNAGTAYGSASGDKMGEFDGDNYRPDSAAQNGNVNTRLAVDGSATNPTPSPLSAFNMWNITAIGSSPTAPQEFTPVSPAAANLGLQWRNGAAGNVFNSIVTNTGTLKTVILDTGATGAPGFDAIDNANAGLSNVVCTTLANGAALAAADNLLITNGNALNLVLGGTAAGANTVYSAGFNNLINRDQTFDPTGNADGKLVASLKATPLNPRPAAGFVGVGGCVAPFGPGLDRSATYRGAFPSTAPTLWTTGWTAMNEAGLLAN